MRRRSRRQSSPVPSAPSPRGRPAGERRAASASNAGWRAAGQMLARRPSPTRTPRAPPRVPLRVGHGSATRAQPAGGGPAKCPGEGYFDGSFEGASKGGSTGGTDLVRRRWSCQAASSSSSISPAARASASASSVSIAVLRRVRWQRAPGGPLLHVAPSRLQGADDRAPGLRASVRNGPSRKRRSPLASRSGAAPPS